MSSDETAGIGPDAPGGAPEAVTTAPGERRGRPLLERIGLALIALVMTALFLLVAIAGWVGGEPFLAAMGALGALMTLWLGGLTLLRG